MLGLLLKIIHDLSDFDKENSYISDEIVHFDPGFWNNQCKQKKKKSIRFYGGIY